MLDSLLQFGLGATLIGAFFIPFVLKLYNDNKALNKALQDEKDKRLQDAKESRDLVLEPNKQITAVMQAVLELKMRGGHE